MKNFNIFRTISLALLLMLGSTVAFAQIAVQGTVVDIENGEPVIGCAVYSPDNVKGGVATNVDGVFLIKLPRKLRP